MTIKGSLLSRIAIVKAFTSRFLVQNLAGSRDLWIGGRRWPHIWVPGPRFAYSLYNFRGATMTIKGSLLSSIPIVKAFSSRFLVQNLAGSRDLWIGVAGDPIFEFPDPDLPIHYTTFMGLRWRLRVLYSRASPLLRPFWREIFWSPIENWPKICVFWRKWGQNVKFCFRDPPKGTSLRETTSFDVLIVKIGAGAVGWQKNQKKLAESLNAKFRIFGGRKGVIVSLWNFAWGSLHARRSHPCKFRWRSVRGFLRSNFPLFHWLALSSLKHSGTTVPACDAVLQL